MAMETIANPFALVTRKGILTLDEGTKIQAEFTIPAKYLAWHDELEKKLVREFNESQPRAVHKVVKIHLMRK